MPTPPVLISAAEVLALLPSDTAPALLDVRWALGDTAGYQHFLGGHIPGARYVDLDRELAAPPSAHAGRHPLPDLDDLQASARGWGIKQNQAVVVYDATGALAAARAWWLLRWAGIADVRILDGGLAAWTAAAPVETGTSPVIGRGDVTLSAGHLPVLDADQAAARAGSGILLDARAAERYRGDAEPIDPRAGHIPGAVSAPTSANLTPEGRFLPADVLRHRFVELGATDDVGVYCGSGVTAAHEVAALSIAGIPAALYPGSWSQWSADPQRPVATGDQPGRPGR